MDTLTDKKAIILVAAIIIFIFGGIIILGNLVPQQPIQQSSVNKEEDKSCFVLDITHPASPLNPIHHSPWIAP
jgi:hypothetical protein